MENQTFMVCLIAVLLDKLLGEPKYHPLVLFGHGATWIESKLNTTRSIGRGVLAMSIVILPITIIVMMIEKLLSDHWLPTFLFHCLVLYLVIGWQSLQQHAIAVSRPLEANNLPEARKQLSMIVSRDTGSMEPRQIAGSTIESVLENGNDCLFASLFWYVILGPWAAVLHRLVNTLDAMWGYRTEQYEKFGKAAARFDDLLGWLPARLTALSYACSGKFAQAIRSWRTQAPKHKSPNGGAVMASGAGALLRTLGGPVSYHGKVQEKPFLGFGQPVTAEDIQRSLNLVNKSLIIWLVSILIIFAMI